MSGILIDHLGNKTFKLLSVLNWKTPSCNGERVSWSLCPVCPVVQCPVGTYFSMDYAECESCRRGSYQDEEGQTECKLCPDGFSTPYLHSRSLSECKGRCLSQARIMPLSNAINEILSIFTPWPLESWPLSIHNFSFGVEALVCIAMSMFNFMKCSILMVIICAWVLVCVCVCVSSTV